MEKEVKYSRPYGDDFVTYYTVTKRTRTVSIEDWIYESWTIREGERENVVSVFNEAIEPDGYKFMYWENYTLKEPYDNIETLREVFENRDLDWYDVIEDYIIDREYVGTGIYDDYPKMFEND